MSADRAVDPLAEALRVEYERWSRDLNRKETWEEMAARVARDHIAAEVRRQGTRFADNGDADAAWVADAIAARIAKGEAP